MSRRSRWRSLAAQLAGGAPALIDLYRLTLHPRWELANWRDHVATRRALGWLREVPIPPAEAPAALIVLRREDIFDIKCGAMLGAALKLEGVRPVILANHPGVPRIRRFARAFGIDAVRFRSEFPLDVGEREEAHALTSELIARDDDFGAVREWTYRGHKLGDRVLSTLIRRTLLGEPNLRDSAVRSLLEEILGRVLANYLEAEKVLTAVGPSWVLADETGYADNGPLVDVALALGLDVLESSPFVREGALMLKRMNSALGRAASASVSVATLERLQRGKWTAADDADFEADTRARYAGSSALQRMYQWHTREASREEICREFELDPSRPIAVVFSHVLWDASFFYGEDLFTNYQEWLEQTVLAAAANPKVSWLIKTHPANAFRLKHGDIRGPVAEIEVVRRCMAEPPDHVRLVLPETRISSLALFRHADVGVTVRGTAGLEMACFGKPVLTAGTGHYTGLSFTHDSRTREDYLSSLRCIESLTEPLDDEQKIRARRYANALFRLRPWAARSFELRLDYPEEGWHPLDRNVIPRARSLEEARQHGDLHRWAHWVVKCKSADYLEDSGL